MLTAVLIGIVLGAVMLLLFALMSVAPRETLDEQAEAIRRNREEREEKRRKRRERRRWKLGR